MTNALFIFLSLLHPVATQAGAVSAGGLQAPAKAECLFLDPAQPYSPRNFLVYDFQNGRDSASLIHVDLRTRETLVGTFFKNLKTEAHGGELSYRGEAEGISFRVAYDRGVALTHEQYMSQFSRLAKLDRVSFQKDTTGYLARLSLDGKTYSGICTEGPLFYYFVGGPR